MAKTLYTARDTGSPRQQGTIYQYGTGNFQLYMDILIKCLVQGYGDKPAAGWTLTCNNGVCTAFQPPSKAYVVCFVKYYEYGWWLYLADSVTTYPTSGEIRPIGDNVRSNGWAADTNPGGAGHSMYTGSSYMYDMIWSVVADEKTFLFAVNGSDNPDWSNLNSNASWSVYCGELDNAIGMSGLANVVLQTSTYTPSYAPGSTSFTSNNYGLAGSCTVLRRLDTGLIPQGGGNSFVRLQPWARFGNQDNWVPSANLPGIVAGDQFVVLRCEATLDENSFIGRLRGAGWSPQGLDFNAMWRVAQLMGLTDSYSKLKDIVCRSVTLPDGYQYALCGSGRIPYLLTNNPAFWGS